MMTILSRHWMLATVLVFTLLLSTSFASLIRRDEHALVIPLTYDASQNLMTASMTIGTSGSTYNLIVDSGSPFLVVEKSSFHASPSTYDPINAGQPDLSGSGGYMFTNPDGKQDKKANDKGEVKPTMHFVEDQAYLNAASGERAGGGAMRGNVTVGLAELDELKSSQGLLGLSPPFSLIRATPPAGAAGAVGGQQASPPPAGQQKGGEKDKREKPSKGKAGGLPSLDVSFLHSYLSPGNRKTLGITGSSHFFLDFSPSSLTSPEPTGELVFPLSGTTLPTSTSGYNYSAAITIDPASGSTYPAHPFWGIAHRPDFRFFLDGNVLPDVRIDALLLDSGTSGIIAPPSEVQKIFAAAGKRIATSPPAAPGVVQGKTGCGEDLRMGFEIGPGRKAAFEAVRRKVKKDGQFVVSEHDDEQRPQDRTKRGLTTSFKSYSDPTNLGTTVKNLVSGVTGLLGGLVKRHPRHHRRQLLQVGVGLSNSKDEGAGGGDKETLEVKQEQCQVTLMGSPQVEKMFPSNGPDFKVWIVGMEFFQKNLVYHNLDTATTMVVPRNEAVGSA